MVEALSATRASSARYDAALHDFVELLRQGTPGGDHLPETIEETLVGGVAWIVNQQIRRGGAEEADRVSCPSCRSSSFLRTRV